MILALFLLSSMRIVTAMEIHEETTPDELVQAFHTPNIKNLPTHSPRIQKKNSSPPGETKMKVFEEKMKLNPSDGVFAGYETPIYLASFNGTQTQLTNYNLNMDLLQRVNARMYEDSGGATSLIIIEEKKNAEQIIAKVGEKKSWNNSQHLDIPAETINLKRTKRGARRRIPDIVYPEILVVVDNSLYRKIGGNIWDALPYLLNFWSSVDMKFRTLDKPKFRLNIAGFVIDTDGKALSYMRNNSFPENKVIVVEALEASKTFWYEMGEQIPVDKYDVLVTMTADSICLNSSSYESLGGSLKNGACKIDNDHRTMNKVSIIFDEGGYSGVLTAAHELGHLFGASHDDKRRRRGCIDEVVTGIMLSDPPPDINPSLDWSNCSRRDFRKFIKGANAKCLYNKPKIQKVLPRYLPGMFMNTDQQCERTFGTKTCSSQGKGGLCHLLYCDSPDPEEEDCSVLDQGAADGTPCGKRFFCLNNQCVDRQTLIPKSE